MTEDRKPAKPGMSEVSPKFVDEAEAATAAPPSSVSVTDNLLVALAADYYAAYIARDAATDAREEVEHLAEKSDSEAVQIETAALPSGDPGSLFLPFLFDKAGTLTPTREQVSQYCDTDKLTEAVMRHLEEYGERCVAALEAAGWPEKQVEYERAEQRVDTLFDQMVQTPAQGLRGIAAKMKGLVYPHEWEFLRDGKLDNFDDEINTEMFVSLVADVERLAGEAVPITKLVIDEPLLALERRWREALKAWGEAKSEPKADELTKLVSDAQEEMAVTPARTIAGVLVKLRLYADLNSRRSSHSAKGAVVSIDQLPLDNLELDQAAVVGAMHDLERLAATTTVAETPPAEDAALFDALAEYDRLTAISQDLERRKEVFRPGIPEADEANKAYEAAYDEAMAVWEKTRKILATTQAGLFAKLQATIRFMTDLGQDELYEAEWQAIKADVQRVAGRAGS